MDNQANVARFEENYHIRTSSLFLWPFSPTSASAQLNPLLLFDFSPDQGRSWPGLYLCRYNIVRWRATYVLPSVSLEGRTCDLWWPDPKTKCELVDGDAHRFLILLGQTEMFSITVLSKKINF